MAELTPTSSLFPPETEHLAFIPRETEASSFIPYKEEHSSSVLTTFYSFKGGVGRTQSLYNVAARLTSHRRQVLMVDVDLEAPGLSITLDEERRQSKEGFAEIAGALLDDLETAFANQKDLDYLKALKARYAARLQRALHELEPPMSPKNEDLEKRLKRELDVQIPDKGSLSLLSVGRVGTDYTQQVAQLPLSEAYDDRLDAANQAVVKSLVEDFQTPVNRDRLRTRGHVFATLFREILRTATVPDRTDETFDHVLIDSRSGLADVGGLCLLGLAETRVVLTGLNEQNVTGTKMVLDDIAEVDDDARDDNHLITVFSPIPQGEADLLAKRLEAAKDTLNVSDDQVRRLHYHPRIALEEKPFTEPFHEHTRIYDDYEDLTDHLLALTGSDARSLVSDALERFREDEDEESGDEATEKKENRYNQLVNELIPAAFLDEDHVESTLDGVCTQTMRSKPYDLDATCLFDFWVALSPEDFRVLGTSTDFYNSVRRKAPRESAKSLLRRILELVERISKKRPEESQTWYNWGTQLSQLAQLITPEDPERAESLYQEAFDKYKRAVDIRSDLHEAWFNWGNDLRRLAQLAQDDDPDRADSLYQKAFEKYQKAVDINPDRHRVWFNWGTHLAKLAQLIQDDEPNRAESIYQEAFEKYRKAVDINPDKHETWYSWGTYLGQLAQLVQNNAPDRADSLYQKAFEKYQKAVDINPDKHEAWFNWGTNLSQLAQLVQKDAPDRTDSLYQKAFEKYQKAASINPDRHRVWFNWGTHLGHFAQLVQDEDPNRADSLYQKAFEKYQKTVDINPDKHGAWYNWGIDLVRLGQLLRSQNQPQKADQAFSDAVEKLQAALSNDVNLRARAWLIVALAERKTDDDIAEAGNLLNTALEQSPVVVYWFETEDAEAVRTHPELRKILDEYREKIDENEVEEDPESTDDLDAPDLSD